MSRKDSKHPLSLPGLCILAVLIGLASGAYAASVGQAHRQTASEVLVTVRGVPITTTMLYRKLEIQIGRQVIARMTSEALELKFAESLGAIPSRNSVEESAKQRELMPGWSEFASEHNISEDDVRRICRIKLARELAIKICNANSGAKPGAGSAVMGAASASDHNRSARYVERFAEYRKSAVIQVYAREYAADLSSRSQ